MTEIGGTRYRAGAGEPLLLVHGAFCTWRVWEAVVPGLERCFDVLAPTLVGHFEGDRLPVGSVTGIEALADGLERELDAAGWETAHIAGNSLGALLALELAQRGRARSVVALAPGGDRPGSRYGEQRLKAIFTTAHVLARRIAPHADRFCASVFGRKVALTWVCAHPERLTAGQAAHTIRALAQCPTYADLKRALPPDRPRELDRIRCPVLLAWSSKDLVLPFKRYGPEYCEALPHAELRMLDGVGHIPMTDDPAAIATLIRDTASLATSDRGDIMSQCAPARFASATSCTPTSADGTSTPG